MRLSVAPTRHPRFSLSAGHPGRALTDVNSPGAEDIVLRLEMHDYVFDLYLLGSASAPQARLKLTTRNFERGFLNYL
jgi:hypothetical protein